MRNIEEIPLIDDIEREKIPIHQHKASDHNILILRVGTNCPQGGKASEGGRTLFSLENGGGTVWELHVTDAYGTKHFFDEFKEFSLVLGGDAEAVTFQELLKIAARELSPTMQYHRTTMYFEESTWQELNDFAQEESRTCGTRVTTAEIVRQIVKGARKPLGQGSHEEA